MIRTKSVYSAMHRNRDGLRVLVTRVRGRGLPSSRYDVWMANLGPSEKLLSAIRGEKITWAEFVRRYRSEILTSPSIDKGNRNIKNHGQKFTLRLLKELARKGTITLMCHCDEDQTRCHRHVLKRLVAAV